jgi:hypothetical protein
VLAQTRALLSIADLAQPELKLAGERFNPQTHDQTSGLGGTVRLVMLPYEAHGYRARESVMHLLWEMDNWLEKYVKNGKTEKTE